jgi:ubiquinol-cytochrome c reductase cytochrome b subunit
MANVFTRIGDWVNERTPGLMPMYRAHMTEYYAPKNFNLWYYFGSLAILVLVNQIVTGIFLTMNYNPSAAGAFDSVQYIMRDVEWGWLIRYMHSTGASLFFVVIFLHMFRGIMYGSYKKPRELVWLLGMLIFLVLMAEAFMGYVLPWGNMSFWGAKVIISLFGTIPFIGQTLVEWIMGDFLPADATLNRFFALHVIALPIVLLLLVVLHIAALHEVGSNNPDGVEIKKGPKGNRWDATKPSDGIPFHPYYTLKDLVGVGFFLLIAAFIIFFAPTFGGWFLEHDNSIMANNLVTPAEIKPVWYFTPFYAILRAVPDQRLGALLMGLAVASFLVLPWLDRSPVKSMRYRGPISRLMLGLFVISFIALGYLGLQPAEGLYVMLARIFAVIYFAYFWLMPFYSRASVDACKPVPERVLFHAH